MMNVASSGRRHHPRFPISRLAAIQERAYEDLVYPELWMARTSDLSAGGMRLETDRTLERGDRLTVDIAVGDEVLHADVTVVHVQPHRAYCSAGARFESSLDDSMARKLLDG